MPCPTRPRRCRAVAAALLVAALALAGCTGGGSATPSGSPTPPTSASPTAGAGAQFTDCSSLYDLSAIGIPPSRRQRLTIACAVVNVPLNYSDVAGATISLRLVRVRDTNQHDRIGSLLVNPGGPGASGIAQALQLAGSMSEDVLDRFDLIGFDPRGVGLSSTVRCSTSYSETALLTQYEDVRTAAGVNAVKNLYGDFAATCKAKYGDPLAAYSTVNSAKDLESVRQAVGDAAFNFYGTGYGSELGATYATLYPTAVRAAVFDAPVDPAVVGRPLDATLLRVRGLEAAFHDFETYCAAHSSCATGLGVPSTALTSLIAVSTLTPIPTSVSGDGRTAGPATVLAAVAAGLAVPGSWPALATALTEARGGDAKGVFALADAADERDSSGTYSNLVDMSTVVTCNDTPVAAQPSDAVVEQTAKRWAVQYPFFGLWAAQSLLRCTSWQPVRTPPPTPSAKESSPMLVVGNTGDPVTPYVGAQQLTTDLGAARLLVYNGYGHTAYGQSSCVATAVNTYLVQTTLPDPGTSCP